MKAIDPNAIIRLKAHRHLLTFQQYQTIKGQILAGDAVGAMKGLDKIIQRKDITI